MALTKTTPHTQGQFFLLESLVDEGQPTGDRKKKHLGHILRVFSKPYMVYYGHAQYKIFYFSLRFLSLCRNLTIFNIIRWLAGLLECPKSMKIMKKKDNAAQRRLLKQ